MASFSSDHKQNSSFILLPSEIRIQIYECLITLRNSRIDIGPVELHHHMRHRESRKYPPRRRLRTITDRVRGISGEVTNCWTPKWGKDMLDLRIMIVSQQIHEETCKLLYSDNLFSKRPLTSTKDFDRCEWRAACEYLSQNTSLERLHLCVYSVRSRFSAYESSVGISQANVYEENNRIRHFTQHPELEWARQLTRIKGLKEVQVEASIEQCYPPRSGVMEFFLRFSPMIEGEFALWLKAYMTDRFKLCRSHLGSGDRGAKIEGLENLSEQ